MFLATRAFRGTLSSAPRLGTNLTYKTVVPTSSVRTFSLFGSKKKVNTEVKTTLFKKVEQPKLQNSLILTRRAHYEPVPDGPIPATEEEWQQLAARMPLLPYGVVGSLVIPLGFLGAVGIGAILWANSDYVKEKRKEKEIREMYAEQGGHGSALTGTQKMLMTLFGINFVVFLFWQNRRMQYLMNTHFLHGPLNKSPISGLLACFSHKTTLHFVFNMIGLMSFGIALDKKMSKEQILAFYIAGGCFSSAASHLFKLATRDLIPSLGASGAVYGLVAASTYLNPDARYSFIFFPMFDFSASTLLPVLIAFDAIGAVCGALRIFRIGFDHAAHLGGAGFGWYYTQYLVNKHKKRQELAQK